MTGADRQRGLTLIEVLVALAVLGLLIVALNGGVRAGLTLWQAQQRHAEGTAELDAAARVLRNLLTRIPTRPMGDAEAAGLGLTRFEGSAGGFAFVGALPTGFGATRLARITLAARRRKFVVLWSPYRHEVPMGRPAAPAEAVLVRGIERLTFDYWGAPRPNDPPRWQAWWDALYPPQLIRIRVGFAEGDPRRWPDLLVAPLP